MPKFKCTICGEIFEAPSKKDAICPLCGAMGDALELVEEEKEEPKNPYAGRRKRICSPRLPVNPRQGTNILTLLQKQKKKATSR